MDSSQEKNNTDEPRQRELKRITPEDMPIIYTNSIDISYSIFDIVLALGIIEEASERALVIRHTARVAMSPQHAKAFSFLLKQKIDAYEEKFGVLPDVAGILRLDRQED